MKRRDKSEMRDRMTLTQLAINVELTLTDDVFRGSDDDMLQVR